jgi:predicted RNA-binding Zn ribbon-like protein
VTVKLNNMAEPGDRPPAPGPLRLVQAFVNSLDVEEQRDELTDARALTAWLRNHVADTGRLHATRADLERALALREALREHTAAHNGLDADTVAATAILNATSERARLRSVLDAGGDSRLIAAAAGADGALGAIVAAVHAAVAQGTWPRLKACEADHCRWAFYDASRNRSGRWCAMAICGSRAKSRRAYRRARAGAT